jgi:hypothetical protein
VSFFNANTHDAKGEIKPHNQKAMREFWTCLFQMIKPGTLLERFEVDPTKPETGQWMWNGQNDESGLDTNQKCHEKVL